SSASGEPFFTRWLAVDVLWKIAAGVGIGWLGGKVMGYLTFYLPKRSGLSETRDGFVALGITCLAYGSTEMLHGYGFLAVFVAAVALRSVERQHQYHQSLHDFTEQIERLLMMVLLVCFGAAIAEGSIFGALSWRVIVTIVLMLFVVRPLAAWVGLIGFHTSSREKAVIAFFGIRGLGSFYYLAFALGQAEFEGATILWVTVCFAVLSSVVMHGVMVTPIMHQLDRGRPRSWLRMPRARPR
ncbi:MAG: sodium:proton antiporter, partial [Mesorhizobium sp.]